MQLSDFNKLFDRLRPIQHRDELWWLTKKVAELNPKTIVEIGVEFGGTYSIWGNLLPADGLLVGIDCSDAHKERIEKNISDIECKHHVIFADSHDETTLDILRGVLANRKVDFLFIDGDHLYEGVKSDDNMYSPLVRSGGIVGFHDINCLDGVSRFWQEISGEKYSNTIKIGIGYIIKG